VISAADGRTALASHLKAFPDAPPCHSYHLHGRERDSEPAFSRRYFDTVAGTAGGMTGGPPQFLRISAARCAREALAGFDARGAAHRSAGRGESPARSSDHVRQRKPQFRHGLPGAVGPQEPGIRIPGAYCPRCPALPAPGPGNWTGG